MIARIQVAAIINSAVLLNPEDVQEGDARLAYLGEGYCRLVVHPSPSPSFVLWPNSSLGFVKIQPYDGPKTQEAWLIEAYNEARQQLEKLTQAI